MHKKKTITEKFDCDINYNDIDDVIEYLIKWNKILTDKGFHSIKVTHHTNYREESECDFKCERHETDSEFQVRVDKLKAEEVKQLMLGKKKEGQEYRKYLELKAKFEKT